MLNAAQERAVAHLSGPCLVIAGAGSGKTRVITHKIGRLLRAGLEPDQIAAITFTNKAAAEMRERAAQLVDKRGVASKLAISTFHALGVRMLRESGAALGLKPKFSILAADDVTGLLRDAGATTDNAQARRWQWTISLWKNAMLTPEAAARVAQNDDEGVAAKVYARYADMLQAYQAVDFDDLIWLPVTLLQQHAEVRAHWQDKLRYLLVDEYQDTNAAQYDLLRLLVGDKGRFTAVGDDDQSIYGWRGATLDNLKRLQTDWPALEVIKLEQNYRSTNAILRAANAIIQSNPKLYPKSLWSEHGEGEAVEVRAAQNEDEEAQMVTARIQALRSGRNAELAHIAVLYRANHQSRPLEQALRRANIPYVVSGGQSFFDRAEIKDVCAYLRLLANPDDDPAFLRAVTTPRRGIGPQTLAALSSFAGQWKVSMFEALFRDSMPAAVGARPADHLREFGRLLHDIEWRARTAPAGELLREMLETIGFRAWLEEHSDNPREAEQRWKNVDDFCGWIERKAEEDKVGLTQIAQTISLITQLQERGDQRDAVTLCTLHAAKGLEWPHVVLAGCEEGLLPFFTDERPLSDTSLEEERRLMYVGVTRARQTLVLSWCQKRKQGRGAAARTPSRFIGEMQTAQPRTSNKDAAMARIAALRSRLGAAAAEETAAATAAAKT